MGQDGMEWDAMDGLTMEILNFEFKFFCNDRNLSVNKEDKSE